MEFSPQEITRVVEKYPIGTLQAHMRIKRGFQNYSFLLKTSKGKFVLRIGKKTKKAKDILFEITMLSRLQDLPVPKHIKNHKRAYITKIKGHNAVIYHFLQGTTPKKLSQKQVSETARLLAAMHKRLENVHYDKNRFAWYDFYDSKKINSFKKFLLKELPSFSKDIEYLAQGTKATRLPKNLPKGPIHCDVKRENLLAKNNRVIGLLDFDNCMPGPFLLDLAISITWLCTCPKKGLEYNKTRVFVKNYELIRPLNVQERKNLFKAIKYAYISHEFVDFYVYAKDIIAKSYFDFGRSFLLGAAKKLDHKKFLKVLNAKNSLSASIYYHFL